jgi:hypothetical protein
MSYKIKDLDKGFEDFIVDDIKGIQAYIVDLENNDFDLSKVDTFEKAKKFLNDEYNIDVEMV